MKAFVYFHTFIFRITGCIANVTYPIGHQRNYTSLVGNVQIECLDKCSENEENQCFNNGKCIKYFTSTVSCDCSATGYTGKYCSKAGFCLIYLFLDILWFIDFLLFSDITFIACKCCRCEFVFPKEIPQEIKHNKCIKCVLSYNFVFIINLFILDIIQGVPKKCIHTLKHYYIELKTYMKVINVQNYRLWLQCTSQTVHKRKGKRFELFR